MTGKETHGWTLWICNFYSLLTGNGKYIIMVKGTVEEGLETHFIYWHCACLVSNTLKIFNRGLSFLICSPTNFNFLVCQL